MGCASSKLVEPMDVYRPSGASLALFNIDSVEEPWLLIQQQQQQSYKGVEVPKPILEKLHKLEQAPDAPHSWSEVSKALEDLKPTLGSKTYTQSNNPDPDPKPNQLPEGEKKPTDKHSIHTLEELDAKLKQKPEPTKTQQPVDCRTPAKPAVAPSAVLEFAKSNKLKDNYFIVMDRLQKSQQEGGGSEPKVLRRRRDPLEGLPERCPPGGAEAVVLYTTTLRGVRRTFEDCKRVRSVMEGYRVVVDERDVSLHSEYLTEVRELLGGDGGGGSVPRLFIKGRYVGGVNEIVELNERGKLGEMLDTVGGGGWNVEGLGEACEGCGGLRFIPCLDCSGSCKVLDEKQVFVRCSRCNENGLILCPICH